MSTERLENIEKALLSCVESQTSDLKNVDAHELGEAVDMIKDLTEAIYYQTITEAMKETKQQPTEIRNFYTERVVTQPSGDMVKHFGGDWSEKWGTEKYPIMYMGPDTHGNMGGNTTHFYDDGMTARMNGISPHSRRMYMEAKDMRKGSVAQMQELEKYMSDLSKDISDMINDASPEEKLLLQQKLMTLANKVKPNNLNVQN